LPGRFGDRGDFAEFERDPALDQLRIAAQHDPFDDGTVGTSEIGPQSDLVADLVDDRSEVASRLRVSPGQDGRDLREDLVLVVDAIDGAHQRVDLLGHPGTHLLDLGRAEIGRSAHRQIALHGGRMGVDPDPNAPFGLVSALDPVQVAHQALRATSQHTRPTDGDSVVRGFQCEDNLPRNQARDKSRGKDEAERVGGAAATKILAITQ
jgi:hypothetical protein